jgi:uncharacterized protein YcaQ
MRTSAKVTENAPIRLSLTQARRFMLHKQGLLGGRRFKGKEGAWQFIRQAGSIQFDPINICGRNPDLVLQSRVQGYRRSWLAELLYEDRRLMDYFDKELCIFPVEDWPHFAQVRAHRGTWLRSHDQVTGARSAVLEAIGARGPLCSKELEMEEKVHWFWGASRLSRATLEHLFYEGTLGIHHKNGNTKYYDLMERLLPGELYAAPDPHADQESLHRFLLKRRVGAVGLLWNRASSAFLGIENFKAPQRQAAFSTLQGTGELQPVCVEGIRDLFYCLSSDVEAVMQAQKGLGAGTRCELLAPLDTMLWDRALIKALFDFDYTWEIYTPATKRRYGYYVLPILHRDRLVGRVEPVYNVKKQQLSVKGIWFEEGIRESPALTRGVEAALARLEQACREE